MQLWQHQQSRLIFDKLEISQVLNGSETCGTLRLPQADLDYRYPKYHNFSSRSFFVDELDVFVLFTGIFFDFEIPVEIILRSLDTVKNRSLTIRTCNCLVICWQL